MFYLHIPKTGGQTLARRLASAFPPGHAHLQVGQFTYPGDQDGFGECLAAHDFVEAHVTGQLLHGREIEDLLVTVREPVAQIMSNFRHIRRESFRPLSRAARELDPGQFFDHFGDFFADFQTRYLLSCFMPLGIEEQRQGFWRIAARQLPEVLGKVRWLVPTDRIDGFVPLWEAETGRRAAERTFATNHAPPDDLDLAALEAAIRARPVLFAVDNVLYHYACARHAEWKASVEQRRAPWDYPANASRVFHSSSSAGRNGTTGGQRGGIWLRRGWYPAEETPLGPGNWAGPSRRSDITVRRAAGQDRLVFDVAVVNGIAFTDIAAFLVPDFTDLPVTQTEVARGHWRYRVDLTGLPETSEIALMVPDCYAPINVFAEGEHGKLVRRSFLATGWALAAKTDDAEADGAKTDAAKADAGEAHAGEARRVAKDPPAPASPAEPLPA